jgi:hypothetical protein
MLEDVEKLLKDEEELLKLEPKESKMDMVQCDLFIF